MERKKKNLKLHDRHSTLSDCSSSKDRAITASSCLVWPVPLGQDAQLNAARQNTQYRLKLILLNQSFLPIWLKLNTPPVVMELQWSLPIHPQLRKTLWLEDLEGEYQALLLLLRAPGVLRTQVPSRQQPQLQGKVLRDVVPKNGARSIMVWTFGTCSE